MRTVIASKTEKGEHWTKTV